MLSEIFCITDNYKKNKTKISYIKDIENDIFNITLKRNKIEKKYIFDYTNIDQSNNYIENMNEIINVFYYDVPFKKADIIIPIPLEEIDRNDGYLVFDGEKFIDLEREEDEYGYIPLFLIPFLKVKEEDKEKVFYNTFYTHRGFGLYLKEKS